MHIDVSDGHRMDLVVVCDGYEVSCCAGTRRSGRIHWRVKTTIWSGATLAVRWRADFTDIVWICASNTVGHPHLHE